MKSGRYIFICNKVARMREEYILITIKEYARKKGISHQAVYKKLSLHREEVVGHVVLLDGIKYLDQVAVEVLEQNRTNDPRIKKLEKEMKKLKTERTKLKKKLKEYEKYSMQLELQSHVYSGIDDKISNLELENESLKEELKKALDSSKAFELMWKAARDSKL